MVVANQMPALCKSNSDSDSGTTSLAMPTRDKLQLCPSLSLTAWFATLLAKGLAFSCAVLGLIISVESSNCCIDSMLNNEESRESYPGNKMQELEQRGMHMITF